MEKTPLQLYQRAYNLQYKEENITEAYELYKSLIKTFPESDVAGYAAIQLSKIQAQGISEKMPKNKSVSHDSFPIMHFIFAIFIVAIIGWLYFNYLMDGKRHVYNSTLFSALSKAQSGFEDDALAILSGLKVENKRNPTAYFIAADIYRKRHDYENAKKELESISTLNPSDPLISLNLDNLKEEEASHNKKKQDPKMGQSLRQSDTVHTMSNMPGQKKTKLLNMKDVSYF
ncbi:MAG: tetratricopeptide repeat protein [Chitinivibrionales bacterium]|nr:tetratricopeptide repeat protein [Chitinivibrionales bacterium]